MFLVIRSTAGIERKDVETYSEAARAVRAHIEAHDLGAGCVYGQPAFKLATIAAGRKVRGPADLLATVSYNGRVWSCKDGSEIVA